MSCIWVNTSVLTTMNMTKPATAVIAESASHRMATSRMFSYYAITQRRSRDHGPGEIFATSAAETLRMAAR